MPTQELSLACTPPEVLAAREWPRPFLFDGGGPASWGHGLAWFGHSPRAVLRIDGAGTATLLAGDQRRLLRGDPLTLLDEFHRTQSSRVTDDDARPFGGGLVALLSYDLAPWIERVPRACADDTGVPVIECGWYDWALRFDYASATWQLASSFLTADELAAIGRDLRAASREIAPAAPIVAGVVGSSVSRAEYVRAVERILEYIAAGDVYQVNLSQRFSVEVPAIAHHRAVALPVFRQLQRMHPMPFAAYFDCGEHAVLSNSPECFLALDGETIRTWPIKGTRPRGGDEVADRVLAAALRRDEKEAAEHVMIVDLERNDLGRLCTPGSVAVGAYAEVRSFPSLHHLESEVHGRLRPGTSLADIVRATFPGGSITGAPKIRAMEIIDELEPVRRGLYTGALGWVNAAGEGMFNIAIRTAVARGNRLTYHAGGAVVADSDPQREYEETLLKTQAFLSACGTAGVVP